MLQPVSEAMGTLGTDIIVIESSLYITLMLLYSYHPVPSAAAAPSPTLRKLPLPYTSEGTLVVPLNRYTS